MIEGRGEIHRVIISRFGGIGDILTLMPVAVEIHRRTGLIVDYSINENLTGLADGVPGVNGVVTRRFFGIDCIPYRHGWYALDAMRPKYKYWVEFKYCVEANSMYRHLATTPERYWLNSQNSNFFNWVDIYFGWAKIDPEEIPSERKRPILVLKDSELEWARKLTKDFPRPLILLQPNSSALPRTIYRWDKIVKRLRKFGGTILVWTGRAWRLERPTGQIEFEVPGTTDAERVRHSAALVKHADVLVAADSGISHVAEALGVWHVTTYTTVPPWTRNKYYRYEIAVRTTANCSPCFSLERGCPLIIGHPEKYLSQRERKLLDLHRRGVPIDQAAKELNTTVEGVNQEFDSMMRRIDALKNIEPECIRKLPHDEIYKAVEKILTGRIEDEGSDCNSALRKS